MTNIYNKMTNKSDNKMTINYNKMTKSDNEMTMK